MDPSKFDQKSLMNQAQHIWSMLDDMAANDPSSYKKFIEKHIKEGKEELAPPKPHMCIRTTLKSPTKETLFVNFFSWQRIPNPKSQDDPVPVMGTSINKEKDDRGASLIVSVAFNPKILEEYGREAKNPRDQDTLINLALDYVEELNKVICSRSYIILPIEDLYKGTLTKLQKGFTQHTTKTDNKFNAEFDELSKTFGPLAGVAKPNGSLLEQMANISVSDDTEKTPEPNNNENKLILPNSTPKKPGLIEEIVNNVIETPKYEIEKSWDENNKGVCSIKIFLPKVSAVAECELDISQEDLVLTVPDKYNLKLTLVDAVDDEQAKAKFIKNNHCLVVSMPLIKK